MNVDQLYDHLASETADRSEIPNTVRYGDIGPDGGPGLLAGLRRFLRDNPEWSVISHDSNANDGAGLTIISRRPEDRPKLPSKLTMASNFTKALASYAASGGRRASKELLEDRLVICSVCPQRVEYRCSVCGCYLTSKAAMLNQECPLGKWRTE